MKQSIVIFNWWSIGENYKENPAIGWLFVTFIIFLLALWQFIKKPLNDFIYSRSEKIKEMLNKNNTYRDEVFQKLQVCNLRLHNINTEIDEIKNSFKKQSEFEFQKIKQAIENALHQSKKKINLELRTEIFQYEKQLKRELSCRIIKKSKEVLFQNEAIDVKLRHQIVEDINDYK